MRSHSLVFMGLALFFFVFASIFFCFPLGLKEMFYFLRSSSLSSRASSFTFQWISCAFHNSIYSIRSTLHLESSDCWWPDWMSRSTSTISCSYQLYILLMQFLLRMVLQYCRLRIFLEDLQLQWNLNSAWPPNASLGNTHRVIHYKIHRSWMSVYLTLYTSLVQPHTHSKSSRSNEASSSYEGLFSGGQYDADHLGPYHPQSASCCWLSNDS